MIYDPITIDEQYGERCVAADEREPHRRNSRGHLPDNTAVGIVTNRDLRFQRIYEAPDRRCDDQDKLITTHNPDLKNASDILLQNKIEKAAVVR